VSLNHSHQNATPHGAHPCCDSGIGLIAGAALMSGVFIAKRFVFAD
jgi:hypothetical protein